MVITAANVSEQAGAKQVLFKLDQVYHCIGRLIRIWVDGGYRGQNFAHWVIDVYRWLWSVVTVLSGLEHAHKHGVIHRNITPNSILITATGQARLISFDYAHISDRTSTIADDIIDDLEKYGAYQAIECQNDPSQASVASDLFSIGLLFYEFLTGVPAFADANQIYECNTIFAIQSSKHNPELSWDWDRWLQKLSAFDPKDRYSNADAALQELILLATQPNLDINNLLPDTIFDNQYRVIKRLGRPGSFAVAYHVFDILRKRDLVLKLVTRDRRSVYDRV
ncbi:protein kinase domain-containing protein [Nostoc sp.]|uniref:protein kinase domain-containing protein n=1 Tax=Nostoc sp. TaxID=1180 RepID=UPI002FFD166E